MTPAPKAMPTLTATWTGRYGWLVALPADRTRYCPDRESVHHLVEREANGSAIRFVEPAAAVNTTPVPVADIPPGGGDRYTNPTVASQAASG